MVTVSNGSNFILAGLRTRHGRKETAVKLPWFVLDKEFVLKLRVKNTRNGRGKVNNMPVRRAPTLLMSETCTKEQSFKEL